jgi:V/A-type H+-transporting ATPase subunit I
MAKVAVVGPKAQLDQTVDPLHRLNLLHIEDFSPGDDKTFDLGSPLAGGSKVSERLLRVRGVMKGANMTPPKDARPFTIENLKALESKLMEVEDELARLVEERAKADDERKALAEEDAILAQVQNLVVPTRLLSGYKSVATAMGFVPSDADLSPLRALHKDAEFLESDEAEGRFIAVFVPREAEKALGETLSRLGFQPLEVPALDVTPAVRRQRIQERTAQVDARIHDLDEKIAAIRERHAAAFFALDEHLSIEADKATSPVRFRTTAHSFMIEGWIPHDAYSRLETALLRATKNSVFVARLQKAALSLKAAAHPNESEGDHTDHDAEPEASIPVMLRNPNRAGPYELLTDTYSRPKYGELDPTVFMWIGFPIFFGLMLGDVGYGLVLLAMVLGGVMNKLYAMFGFQSRWHLNRIFMHSAISSILFGFLYGEFFGLEFIGPAVDHEGHATGAWIHFHKDFGAIALPIARLHYVKALLAISLVIGIVHLMVGLILGIRNSAAEHGMGQAMKHRGSWLFILIGVTFACAALVPSTLGLFAIAATSKTVFLWGALGFFLLGTVLLVMGEGGIALLELPSILSNLLSYTRLVAIGLSGVGIALATNEIAKLLFALGAVGLVFGVILAILGHIVGVLLGILGPAIHSLRLHYVEFFTKFYTGGGTPYQPFGAQRKYTIQEVKQA